MTRFLVLAVQLGLVLAMVHVYRIEEMFGFLRITPVIFGGFLIHACLPLAYRRPFFVLLSFAAIGMVFGAQGAGLIALGLLLIGLCHLPVSWHLRVGLVVAAGGVLAAIRGGWIVTPWTSLPGLLLPILGSMFMFRMAVYLYDIRHEKNKATLSERLGYFFLLPNVCFPLFPVVDYQTFRRTYFDAPSHEIYQKGLLWMFRGVTQLVLYRVVYLYFLPDPTAVQGVGGVLQFMLTNYLLYLRISGQFHLIVGILCLFGFNLPETHHLYYLASSFNDYWRRINIFWKDFMMKLFYYPSFMRLRHSGNTMALVVATLVVFFGTWILHSYQWFWLQGTFPITWPDALFWGILGGLVVYNSLREASGKKKKTLSQQAFSLPGALAYAARVVGMFLFITVLWSLWSARSISEWVTMVGQTAHSGPVEWGVFILALALLVGIGVAAQYATSRGWSLSLSGSHPSFERSAVYTGLGALLFTVAGSPLVRTELNAPTAEFMASIQEERLNTRDSEELDRGYYEGLLDARSYTSALSAVRSQRPETGWEAVRESDLVRDAGPLLQYELKPDLDATFKEAPFRTNAFGMRDSDYTQAKPYGVYRIALVGASYEMAAGVERHESFEALVEDRLNAAGDRQYEILNMAVGGYSVLHYLTLTESRVFDFEPDAVVYALHATEDQRLIGHLKDLVEDGVETPYAFVNEALAAAAITPDMPHAEARERLRPHLNEIIRQSILRIGEVCAARGEKPIWLYIPTTEEARDIDPRHDKLKAWAVDAGFETITVDRVFDGHPIAELQLAPWDKHPNVEGHRLIADRLYDVLLQHADRFDPPLIQKPLKKTHLTNRSWH